MENSTQGRGGHLSGAGTLRSLGRSAADSRAVDGAGHSRSRSAARPQKLSVLH